MISNAAIKAGLAGGIYVDFPNSAAAKKYYLVLSTAIEGKLGVQLKEGLKEGEEACDKVKAHKKRKKI